MVFKTTAIDHSAIPPRRASGQNRVILGCHCIPVGNTRDVKRTRRDYDADTRFAAGDAAGTPPPVRSGAGFRRVSHPSTANGLKSSRNV